MANKELALLAIHGFSGHPEEMRFLGEEIARHIGADLSLPTIPGHATTPEDLAGTNHTDWYRGIEAAYDEVADTHKQIIVIGNSFGANLALKIGRFRQPSAVVGIAIPYLRWHQRLALQTLLAVNRPFRRFWTKPRTGARATERIPGYIQRCYEQIPLRAMGELLRFDRLEMQPAHLAAVSCSTLLVTPKNDPFVPPEAAWRYHGHLGSQTKEVLAWDDPYHLIVQGERKAALAEAIGVWLLKQGLRS